MIDLKKLLDDISYSCGATFNEIDLPETLKSVCVKQHSCYNPTEKLYYSCGYEPICIYCGTCCEDIDEVTYPQCLNMECQSKPKIPK